MVEDKNKGIIEIDYNVLNLPDRIAFEDGNTTHYLYDASGVKHRVTHGTTQSGAGTGLGVGGMGVSVLVPTDYCGPVIYESGKLKRILTPEGYLDANALAVKPTNPGTSINQETPAVIDMKSVMAETLSEISAATDGERMVAIPVNTGTVIIENPATMASALRYHYFVNDYLGNVRAVLTWNNGGKQTTDYTVTQRNDYYAWGLPTSTSLNPEAQPYKREGKEYDEMHGLNKANVANSPALFVLPACNRLG